MGPLSLLILVLPAVLLSFEVRVSSPVFWQGSYTREERSPRTRTPREKTKPHLNQESTREREVYPGSPRG